MNYNPSLAERLNREAELKERRERKKPEENKKAEEPIQVIPNAGDFWTIPNVNYRNGIFTVEFSKSLLDSGNAKTQDDWAAYSEQARKSNGFYTGDMPLYHSLFDALHSQKDNPQSEEARQFIQESIKEKYISTLTIIQYQPKGKDKIIHDYKTSDQYSIDEVIVGEDRFMKKADDKALIALTGFKSEKLNEIYQWINGTNGYIWRLNSKPVKVDERVARFYAFSDWVVLGCDRDPDVLCRSFGVRLARKN